jgi:uncharacterized protein (DUF2336 family)
MTSRLSQADVARLMTDPTSEARVDAATKVAAEFAGGRLNDKERDIATQILRIMVEDAEPRVREALSRQLKQAPDLPHDVALALAEDVDTVALPMLLFSDLLTDEDLIGILGGASATKQEAVAERRRVSSQVAGALLDTRNEAAVTRLVANEGAELDEAVFGRVMTEYKDNQEIADSILRRPDMPTDLAKQLANALSRKIESYLVEKHELPADAVAALLQQVREGARMELLNQGASDAELERLIEQLQVSDRLTPTLVLRALCMGDMIFFEAAMARLANIPVQNARILIHEKGTLGLESIYLRAALPERFFATVQAGVEVAKETGFVGDQDSRRRYVRRLLERMVTEWADPGEGGGEDDIAQLMTRLQQLAA